ncbi:unnamed protein product [Prorocentrum cordatum]|uniref:Reverse transcriptase domain-containing protein n=1 Tax=Prorocentrum cordatum TaxID=2364126 RepID=A0ABN9RC66_9DINO|nr:unnamed protein product [Polarella glacialis]
MLLHRTLVPGRVQVLEVYHGNVCAAAFMNIHNFALAQDQRRAVQTDWHRYQQWAQVAPLSQIFVALGDFNIHGEPAVSFLDPQPTILASIGGDQHHQSFWKSLFASMTEVSSGEPTRFGAHAAKETRIDRVFASLPTHAYPNLSLTLKVDKEPAVLSDRRLSDHAFLDLTIATAVPKTNGIQPIPAFIFQFPRYKPNVSLLLQHSQLQFTTAERRWLGFKCIMTEAARLARNELTTCPVEALQDHWLPIFSRKQVDEQALKDCVCQRAPPNITAPKLIIPSSAVMRRVAFCARASAPGPGRLPCRAWAETDGALEALEEVTWSFFESGVAPPALNDAIFSFIPKGEEDTDRLCCAREAGNWRPISRKNADSKLLAEALNLQPRFHVEEHAHHDQQGFTRGRNLRSNILATDAKGRVAGWNADASLDKPVLLLFDIAAAFPSLGRQWLFQAPNQFQFEMGFVKAVAALCDQAMGFAGCPLSGITWAIAMDVITSAVNVVTPNPKDGETGACADDLGLYLQRMALMVALADVFSIKLRCSAIYVSMSRLYQTSAITVLGYLAQFFDLPPQFKREEIHAVYKMLRMPPSTFRLKDAHSLNKWMPGTAPRPLLIYSLGTQWRAAHFTFNLVQPLFQESLEIAHSACGLPAFAKIKWSPVFWREPQAIAQRLNDMMQGRSAQVPTHRHRDLLRAGVIAHRAVRGAAGAGSKPKLQRAFIMALTAHWMKGDFEVAIAERLAAWFGAAVVPHDLKLRWATFKSFLVSVALSWRWITLRTLAGCWRTSSRVHVTPEVDQCLFGCPQQPDAIVHYLVCDRIQHLVCLPRTFSQATALERLGLGHHYDERGEHSLSMAIQRLVLAYYTYLEVKTQGLNDNSYKHLLDASAAAPDRLDAEKLKEAFSELYSWVKDRTKKPPSLAEAGRMLDVDHRRAIFSFLCEFVKRKNALRSRCREVLWLLARTEEWCEGDAADQTALAEALADYKDLHVRALGGEKGVEQRTDEVSEKVRASAERRRMYVRADSGAEVTATASAPPGGASTSDRTARAPVGRRQSTGSAVGAQLSISKVDHGSLPTREVLDNPELRQPSTASAADPRKVFKDLKEAVRERYQARGRKNCTNRIFGSLRGCLGSALGPVDGTFGAAPGALRAPGKGFQSQSKKSARISESLRSWRIRLFIKAHQLDQLALELDLEHRASSPSSSSSWGRTRCSGSRRGRCSGSCPSQRPGRGAAPPTRRPSSSRSRPPRRRTTQHPQQWPGRPADRSMHHRQPGWSTPAGRQAPGSEASPRASRSGSPCASRTCRQWSCPAGRN